MPLHAVIHNRQNCFSSTTSPHLWSDSGPLPERRASFVSVFCTFAGMTGLGISSMPPDHAPVEGPPEVAKGSPAQFWPLVNDARSGATRTRRSHDRGRPVRRECAGAPDAAVAERARIRALMNALPSIACRSQAAALG